MARVLVVDDRAVNRELVRTILGYAGHDVIEVDSGPDALRILDTNPPDVMVSDVLMPGMDGYELARQVRGSGAATATLPIIFYTANLEAEARATATAVGVDHFVTKNGDALALIVAVTTALEPRASATD